MGQRKKIATWQDAKRKAKARKKPAPKVFPSRPKLGELMVVKRGERT